LKSVNIPDSVVSIGDYAFSSCSKLTSVTIGTNLRSIGEFVFYGCGELMAVEVNEQNNDFKSIGGVLFDGEVKKLIQCPGGKQGEYTIPTGVESINDFAFCECEKLERINIQGDVSLIGYGAFYGCSNLKFIEIGNGVTTIEDGAFYDCRSLESITIPDSVMTIGSYPFIGCIKMSKIFVSERSNFFKSVEGVLFDKSGENLICYPSGRQGQYTVPNDVKSLNEYAFSGCRDLESLTIPSHVISIGDGAFFSCENLESVSYLGKTDPGLDSRDVFSACEKLRYICLSQDYRSDLFCGVTTFSDMSKCHSASSASSQGVLSLSTSVESDLILVTVCTILAGYFW